MFVKVEGDSVIIEKNGKQHVIPFAKLSQASIDQANTIAQASTDQANLMAFESKLITEVGVHRPFASTEIRVTESNEKISFDFQVGQLRGHPHNYPHKDAPWFIFPESDELFWISPADGHLYLLEVNDFGVSVFSSEKDQKILDRAPTPVKERVKMTQKPANSEK
jgi:hypothetical protein